MTSYTLHFEHLDGDTGIGPRTVEADTTRDLAQAVHRHARGYLGSPRVDVHLDEETLTGDIVSHGTTVGRFVLTKDASAQELESRHHGIDELRHGYTLADVDSMARRGAARRAAFRSGDFDELCSIARCAIVEHLYTASQPPTEHHLIRLGGDAVDAYVHGEERHRGVRKENRPDRETAGSRPKVQAYWYANPHHAPSPEDLTVDRIALRQIWPTLSDRQREAVLALAAHENYPAAADALGLAYASYVAMLAKGRTRFRTMWHEHETPSRFWGRDGRAVNPEVGLVKSGRTVSQVINRRARRRAAARAAA